MKDENDKTIGQAEKREKEMGSAEIPEAPLDSQKSKEFSFRAAEAMKQKFQGYRDDLNQAYRALDDLFGAGDKAALGVLVGLLTSLAVWAADGEDADQELIKTAQEETKELLKDLKAKDLEKEAAAQLLEEIQAEEAGWFEFISSHKETRVKVAEDQLKRVERLIKEIEGEIKGKEKEIQAARKHMDEVFQRKMELVNIS